MKNLQTALVFMLAMPFAINATNYEKIKSLQPHCSTDIQILLNAYNACIQKAKDQYLAKERYQTERYEEIGDMIVYLTILNPYDLDHETDHCSHLFDLNLNSIDRIKTQKLENKIKDLENKNLNLKNEIKSLNEEILDLKSHIRPFGRPEL